VSRTIHSAAGGGDIEAVKEFLAAGTDVNAKYWGGFTPLHEAAGEGRNQVAELLIAKGADVNAKVDYETPLDFATDPDNPNDTEATADLLRKHGGKTGEELKGGEPVVEATQSEPPSAKAPDISIHDAPLKETSKPSNSTWLLARM